MCPGAQLAYVVGDQASFFQTMIRTGQLLAEVAEDQGYEVVGIDLFRTRAATATRDELREEVLLLRTPCSHRPSPPQPVPRCINQGPLGRLGAGHGPTR